MRTSTHTARAGHARQLLNLVTIRWLHLDLADVVAFPVRSWDGGFRRRFPCDKKRDTNPFVFRVRLDVFRCASRRDPIDFATQVVSSFITQQITPDVPLDTALWNLRLKRTQAHIHTHTRTQRQVSTDPHKNEPQQQPQQHQQEQQEKSDRTFLIRYYYAMTTLTSKIVTSVRQMIHNPKSSNNHDDNEGSNAVKTVNGDSLCTIPLADDVHDDDDDVDAEEEQDTTTDLKPSSKTSQRRFPHTIARWRRRERRNSASRTKTTAAAAVKVAEAARRPPLHPACQQGNDITAQAGVEPNGNGEEQRDQSLPRDDNGTNGTDIHHHHHHKQGATMVDVKDQRRTISINKNYLIRRRLSSCDSLQYSVRSTSMGYDDDLDDERDSVADDEEDAIETENDNLAIVHAVESSARSVRSDVSDPRGLQIFLTKAPPSEE